MLCLTQCTAHNKLYTFSSSLTASFVLWSCNAHSATDLNTFISALSVLTLRPFHAAQFSHQYNSVSTAFVLCSFNSASLFRVCSAHRFVSYTCTDVQMYRCTHVQMYRCTDVQMYTCTHVQMYRCTDVHMYRCTDVHMYRCTDVHLYICTDVQMYRCTHMFKHL
jgi:hypothetical protein